MEPESRVKNDDDCLEQGEIAESEEEEMTEIETAGSKQGSILKGPLKRKDMDNQGQAGIGRAQKKKRVPPFTKYDQRLDGKMSCSTRLLAKKYKCKASSKVLRNRFFANKQKGNRRRNLNANKAWIPGNKRWMHQKAMKLKRKLKFLTSSVPGKSDGKRVKKKKPSFESEVLPLASASCIQINKFGGSLAKKRKPTSESNLLESVAPSIIEMSESCEKGVQQWKPGSKSDLLQLKEDETSSMACKLYLEGRYTKRSYCEFYHASPHLKKKKKELCKHYKKGHCIMGKECYFMHEEFPCKFYHTGAVCHSRDKCRYSHKPLNEETAMLLNKYLQHTFNIRNSVSGGYNSGQHNTEPLQPKATERCLLGLPPRQVLEARETKQWQKEMRKLGKRDSAFHIKVCKVEANASHSGQYSSAQPEPEGTKQCLIGLLPRQTPETREMEEQQNEIRRWQDYRSTHGTNPAETSASLSGLPVFRERDTAGTLSCDWDKILEMVKNLGPSNDKSTSEKGSKDFAGTDKRIGFTKAVNEGYDCAMRANYGGGSYGDHHHLGDVQKRLRAMPCIKGSDGQRANTPAEIDKIQAVNAANQYSSKTRSLLHHVVDTFSYDATNRGSVSPCFTRTSSDMDVCTSSDEDSVELPRPVIRHDPIPGIQVLQSSIPESPQTRNGETKDVTEFPYFSLPVVNMVGNIDLSVPFVYANMNHHHQELQCNNTRDILMVESANQNPCNQSQSILDYEKNAFWCVPYYVPLTVGNTAATNTVFCSTALAPQVPMELGNPGLSCDPSSSVRILQSSVTNDPRLQARDRRQECNAREFSFLPSSPVEGKNIVKCPSYVNKLPEGLGGTKPKSTECAVASNSPQNVGRHSYKLHKVSGSTPNYLPYIIANRDNPNWELWQDPRIKNHILRFAMCDSSHDLSPFNPLISVIDRVVSEGNLADVLSNMKSEPR